MLSGFRAEFLNLFVIRDIRWQGMLKLFTALAAVFCVLIVFVSAWHVLAFFLGLALVWFTYARPTWVIALLAAYIPFEPFLLKFVPEELYVFARYFSEGLIYLLFAAVFIRRWLERTKRPATPLDLPFYLLLLTMIGSAVANLVPASIAVLGIRQILRFVLLFFAVASLGPSRRFIRKLAFIMLAVVFFQALLGIIQAAAGGALDPLLLPSERKYYESIQLSSGTDQFWEPGTRVFATMGRYDQLGTFLCLFMLIAIGWVYELKSNTRYHKWFFALFAVSSVTLVLTYSRASWFGFLLGFLAIAVALKRDRKVAVSLALMFAALFLYFLYSGIVVKYLVESPRQTVLERLFEAFSYERYRGEYYGLGRVYWAVQTPLTVVAAAPIFGHGPGTYGGGAASSLHNTGVYDKLGLPYGVYGTEGYIDNNWFSLWGEIGTLGLVFYVWMYVALWRVADAVRRKSKDPMMRGLGLGFMGVMLAVALQAFLGTYLEVRTLALYFWLFAGILTASAMREKLL